MAPRSVSDDLAWEWQLEYAYLHRNMRADQPYEKPEKAAAYNLFSTYFYQESADSDDLARYFTKCNKCSLSVMEDGLGDIGSGWLGIFSDPTTTGFSSNISISPKRKMYGGILKFYHDLSSIYKGLWYSLYMPIVNVTHELNLCESNVTNPGITRDFDSGGVQEGAVIQNATQAFNQARLRSGRLSPCKLSKTAIDDMVFDIGWTAFDRAHWHAGIRLDMLIPMGSRPTGEYMFEPMVGNGRHFGLGFGLNFDWNFWNTKCGSFTFITDFRYRYLFESDEMRSFDLSCNGDWSRYLLVSRSGEPSVVDYGINWFTRRVDVTPRSTINLLAALNYQYNSFGFEFGYDFWWRQSDKICMKNYCTEVGIADVRLGDTSASHAQICNSASPRFAAQTPLPDLTYTNVTQSSFDINSGRQPSGITNKIYAAVSADWKFFGLKSLISFGGGYEFGDSCRTMSQWSVWGKTALSF